MKFVPNLYRHLYTTFFKNSYFLFWVNTSPFHISKVFLTKKINDFSESLKTENKKKEFAEFLCAFLQPVSQLWGFNGKTSGLTIYLATTVGQ